ncbi:MAG: hypothetical protein LBQ06_07130, partial [Frankiaceae bacterium]|nr:hypothetical protein [Frankiaceae bacterium]
MTSPDYEALHYPLAASTDWSAPTLHESAAARGPVGTLAPPADGAGSTEQGAPGGHGVPGRHVAPGRHGAPGGDGRHGVPDGDGAPGPGPAAPGHGGPEWHRPGWSGPAGPAGQALDGRGIDDLGVPGTFGSPGQLAPAWGATTYGGRRRNRLRPPRWLRREAPPPQWPADVVARAAESQAPPRDQAGRSLVDLGAAPATAPPG